MQLHIAVFILSQVTLAVPSKRKIKLGMTLSCFETKSLLPGVFISHLHPGSIASTSQQLQVGDHVLSVNGGLDLAVETCQIAWAHTRL